MTAASFPLVLGVTGGVAAYKAAELARLLAARHAVQVVMTEAATRFVTPLTFQALTGRPALQGLWDETGRGMPHIDASRGAVLIVVAPASADFLAKLAHGRADDLLSALCLARDCPLLVAPATNRQMWEHPATRRNVRTLLDDGVEILGPAAGPQACGETGPGRMLEAAALAGAVERRLAAAGGAAPGPNLSGDPGTVTDPGAQGCLAGTRVLITAGPTFEALDPVRGLTNLSSGKTGYALARAARDAGAEVTLVSGPVCLSAPDGVRVERVTSALEMRAAVFAALPGVTIFVAAAAVADYRLVSVSAQKIKKTGAPRVIELTPNPDILAEVAGLPRPPFCVGFALESEHLLTAAEEKRRRKRLPLLVANPVAGVLGGDDTELTLLDDAGAHALGRAPKAEAARRLIMEIAARYAVWTGGVAAAD